jgi:hypothetical protein
MALTLVVEAAFWFKHCCTSRLLQLHAVIELQQARSSKAHPSELVR